MKNSSYKIVVVGSSGVGKTTMVQRLVDGKYQNESQPTVGVEFKSYQFELENELIKLNIWDTAGQERFRSVSKAYFRNAIGAILVFATNDSDSFDELDEWLNDLHQLAVPNAAILLVGSKSDLEDQRLVTSTTAEEFAQRHNLEYIETSACSGSNISEAFMKLAKTIQERVRKGEIAGSFVTAPAKAIGVPYSQTNQNDSKCFC